jgi:hypothetical protein
MLSCLLKGTILPPATLSLRHAVSNGSHHPPPPQEITMSAPRTNLETQTRRHRGPIIGIVAVVLFALVLLFWLLMDTADRGTPADSNAPDAGQTTVPGAPADDPLIPEGDPPKSRHPNRICRTNRSPTAARTLPDRASADNGSVPPRCRFSFVRSARSAMDVP